MLRVSGIAEPASIPRDVPVAAELLIEIQGDNFAYAGEAISANAHQALIRTSAPLRVAAQVTVHVAGTGRSATGWIVSERRELSHFVVEFASETLWDSLEKEANAPDQCILGRPCSFRTWKLVVSWAAKFRSRA